MPPLIPKSDIGDTLTAHIADFNLLTQKLDAAVQTKNEEAIRSTQQDLDLFFGQLDAKKQQEIRIFLEQQKVGQSIQNYRKTTNGRIHHVMDSLVNVARATANTVPMLAEQTTRLIISTIGHVGAGIYKGGRAVIDTFQQAA